MRLLPEEAINWCGVSEAIARIPTNAFYSKQITNEQMRFVWDEDRPFIAILKDSELSNIVTLHIVTIDSDLLDAGDYDPLDPDFGKHITLSKEALIDLSDILLSYGEENLDSINSEIVKQIEEDELNSKRITIDPKFPGTYHFYVVNSLDESTNAALPGTLIQFHNARDSIYIKMHRIKTGTTLEESTVSFLTLTKEGLHKFAMMLKQIVETAFTPDE